MKFYRINKSLLKFVDVPQIDFKWKLPILVDSQYNVILGNCIKDKLDNNVIIVIKDLDEIVVNNLKYIELRIAEEASDYRLGCIDACLREFFNELREPEVEQVSLFNYKDITLITEDNYNPPNEEITYSHGRSNNDNIEEIIEEYEIDEEMLKELM